MAKTRTTRVVVDQVDDLGSPVMTGDCIVSCYGRSLAIFVEKTQKTLLCVPINSRVIRTLKTEYGGKNSYWNSITSRVCLRGDINFVKASQLSTVQAEEVAEVRIYLDKEPLLMRYDGLRLVRERRRKNEAR